MSSTQSAITIKWAPPVDSGGSFVEDYEIFFKLASQSELSWSKVGTVDLNTLQFTHEGISASQDVQYKIRAVTESGNGEFSIRNTFTIASMPTITDAPVILSQSATHINLEWTLTSDGGSVITGYRLYQTNVTTGGEFLVYDGTNIPTVTSASITQITAGHSFKYRVIAINRVGDSDYSTFSDVIFAASAPARPEQPWFVFSTSDSITLEFAKVEDDGGLPVTNYKLYVDLGTESAHNF